MTLEGQNSIAWMLAEFETAEAAAECARRLHELGARRMDAYSPYPSAEIDRALRLQRSTLPRWALAGGTTGALVGFGVQWWLNGFDYPLNVGARPLLSAPSFIPITFETTVLLASLAVFVGFFVKARLPRLSHPILETTGFESAAIDRFWISIETSDPLYDSTSTKKIFEEHGALRVLVKEGVL